MRTDSLKPLIKTYDFYKDIADDVKKWSETSNYDERRRKIPLTVHKYKKNRFDER